MKYRIRTRVYEHLLRLGPAYTEHKSSGSVAATISDGVDSLEQYVGFFIPCLILCFVIPVVLFVAFTVFSRSPGSADPTRVRPACSLLNCPLIQALLERETRYLAWIIMTSVHIMQKVCRD